MKRETLTITMKDELKKQAKVFAVNHNTTIGALIEKLLTCYLEKQKQIDKICKGGDGSEKN